MTWRAQKERTSYVARLVETTSRAFAARGPLRTVGQALIRLVCLLSSTGSLPLTTNQVPSPALRRTTAPRQPLRPVEQEPEVYR